MLANNKYLNRGLITVILSTLSSQVFADDLNGANTAWILTSTALVLFMTIPRLIAILRWLGSLKECFVCVNAVFCRYLYGIFNLVCLWLQPGLWRWWLHECLDW